MKYVGQVQRVSETVYIYCAIVERNITMTEDEFWEKAKPDTYS